MFLNFLRKRKQKKIFAQSCSLAIRTQFIVSQNSPVDHVSDPWVLGYIYGACTATLERMGINPSPEAYEILQAGYAVIFDSDQVGSKVLAGTMDIRTAPVFIEAQSVGGNEISRSSPGSPFPYALGTYLGENKSASIRERLKKTFH